MPKADAEFVYRMEDVLDLYETEHNPENPVVCVDEKSYQFLDDKIKPMPMKKGKAKKKVLAIFL